MPNSFALQIVQAKNLKKSLRDKTNPYVKVTFGSENQQSKPKDDTEDPVWNERYEFDVNRPTENLRIQVWDYQGGLDDLLGELKFDVGGRHAEGSRWWHLQPKPSGEIFLTWNYTYVEPKRLDSPDTRGSPVPSPSHRRSPKGAKGKLEEDDGTLGTLNFEIVNAKNLATADFAESVSAYVLCKYGNNEIKTKTKRKTVNPYWNEGRDYKPMEFNHHYTFEIYDEDEQDRLIGTTEFMLQLSEASTKGSEWLVIKNDKGDTTGDLMIRYKFIVKKRVKQKAKEEKQDDDDEIVLDYEPKITGATGVIPDKRLYIWFQLFDDHFFKIELLKKIMATFTRRERVKDKPGLPPGPAQFVDVPYTCIDEVVEECWKCKSRSQLFCKIRAAAQQFKVSGTVVVPVEEEERLRIKWKESSVMMKEIAGSFKIEKSVKSLWNMFSYGVDEPTHDVKRLTDTRITKRTYLTINVHIYTAIVPDLSRKLAKKIALEEWNRRDGPLADHIDESHLFVTVIKDLAGFWCDTLTEYEYQTFLTALLPLLIKARRECGRTRSPRKRGKKKSLSPPRAPKDKTTDEPQLPLSARSRDPPKAMNTQPKPKAKDSKPQTQEEKLAALLAAPSLVGSNKQPKSARKKLHSANPRRKKPSPPEISAPLSARPTSHPATLTSNESTTETRMQIPQLNNFNLSARTE